MLQIVRIENKWDRDITIPHNGDMYVVPVGESKIVPYDAAASLFGDPRAMNEGKSRGREDVYNQVRGMWNFYLGFDSEDVWKNEKCPQFLAFDVNSGDQIIFVIHDRDGTNGGYIPNAHRQNPESTDQAIVAQRIQEMQDQIAQLTSILASTQSMNLGVIPTAPTIVAAETPAEQVQSTPIAVESELPPVPTVAAKVARDTPRTASSK